ncbi:LmbE family N-acetylglucosaminyl deacetylase [Nakamurella sp. UYEF19]|uniref:PIG-L deacetylase family protein n=1 Tax=Nakamurella sp. UYEF19 TaxID=1756392 RepID=UPI003397446E
MSLIVFSPHLDDGVLSVSAQLARPDALLLTVFGGVPPVETARGSWDHLTGASGCDRRQRERLAENDAAAAALGCGVENWNELELQYRVEELDRGGLTARIVSVLTDFDEIWVPAAVGGHPDHAVVRDLVLDAAQKTATRAQVRLHADLPYSIQFGWPSWVTGSTPDPYLDVDHWLSAELVEGGFDRDLLVPHVHALTGHEQDIKRRACDQYRSQLPALLLDPRATSRWDALLRFEVFWTFA